MSAGGTRRQRTRGIGDSAEAHWSDLVRISGGTIPDGLARRAVALAPATIDWLDVHGFPFASECPRIVYGHEPYGVARTYYGQDEARSLLAVFTRLLEPFIASGRVDIHLSTAAASLIVKGFSVAGVTARAEHGTFDLSAPAVVLATGGFGASPTLFEDIEQRPLVSAAAETSTGDGLEMARAIGGQVTGRGHYLPTFGGLPHTERADRAQWADRPWLVAAERAPWEIYVTRAGRRFVAEDEPSMDEKERRLAEVSDLTFFQIFDDHAVDQSPDIVIGWSAERLRETANARRGIHAAPSLELLAERAGIDPAALAATVARYNASVEQGHDLEFGRRVLPAPIASPPFYALENHGITLVTFAGLAVDEQLRVVRGDGRPIDNLYAVGEILGVATFMGNSFCGGMAVGPAVTLGRWLGEHVADRLGDVAVRTRTAG